MTDDERSRRVAECVDRIHARRAAGETPDLRDFMGEPDGVLEDLAAVLDAEAAFDDVIEPRSGPRFPRVFGGHTLTAELGRGAIGMVYAAVHRATGRHVALKVLRTGFDTDPAARERFRREAAACAAVRHANIVAIHDVGEQDGEAWYSMDLVPGPTLHAAARSGGLPRGGALAACFADVADALHALHLAGIIHRDVKPSNIVVAGADHAIGAPDSPDAARPRFVLADFGLARSTAAPTAERLTSPGALVGTPLYMSPEQVDGRAARDPPRAAIDGRADVYSLGATMYEVIAGRPMLEAGDPVTLLNRILDERPPHLAGVVAGPGHATDATAVSALCDVVMKAVEKRADDRYASAADLRDDLRAVAAGRAPTGRPVTETRHRLRHARRFGAPAALVVAAIGTAAGALAWWMSNRPATLAIHSVPPGEVLVNGTARGTTPVRLDLAPGAHDIALRLDGFAPRTERITLAAGELRDLRQVLVVSDPDDPEAIRRLAAALDVAFPTFSDPEQVRGAGGSAARASGEPRVAPRGGVLPLFPRGPVTLADLATLRLECDDAFRGGGDLVFRRAGITIHEEHFGTQRLDAVLPAPPGVLAALRPGDTIDWGWIPSATGAAVLCTFSIELNGDIEAAGDAASPPDALASRLTAIDTRTADQPPAARRLLRALALLAADRPARAYIEAAAVATDRPASPAAWQLAQESLVRCGLADTRLAIRASHALDAALAARGAR